MTAVPAPRFKLIRPEHGWQVRNAIILHDLRADVVASVELAQVSAWREIIESAILANGGALLAPGQTSWGPHWWELTLLQITGTGDTFEEAVREWAKCARRAARAMEEAA